MTEKEITGILTAGYNRETWKGFLRTLFPLSTFWTTPHSLNDLTSPYVASALRIGDVKLDESGIERSIGLFEVVLDEKVILERNRVGLRNLLKKYWKDMDGAFIVYTQPSSGLWRFTYVSELTGFDASGDYREIKTDPKRYTYVFGDGESCRTAVERFMTLMAKGRKATIADIIEAFSVEKLSKSFFNNYKIQYEAICKYLVSKQGIFKTNFNGDEKEVRDFVKLLLGRITFLYFIQKKGWLGVPVNGQWGEGDKHFLWSVFQSHKHKSLFYQEVLTKLFFDTLNTPRENDLVELPNGKPVRIPFLNGGLFEEENPKYRNLVFEEQLFEDLFSFFNQYNFTIYEDDPNDHTVAVDPEMLGHIFENLLEDNKDKGAYYTPKEIVHYMSQESLIEYLTTWFENKGYEVVGHTSFKDTSETLFVNPNDYNHGQLELETPVYNEENKIDRSVIEKLLKKSLDDSDRSLISQYIDEFNKALDSVKICDPAIGSGAFPMGLLQEIFSAKQTLWHFKNGNLDNFPASEIKLNIIQNSIYGVDIEKGAVDIARLRFWLSLVVDELEPKPLPNLDYKIVVGDSLASRLEKVIIEIDWDIDVTAAGFFGADYISRKGMLLSEISSAQKEFFFPDADKKKLAKKIRNLKIDILINQLNFLIATRGLETKPTWQGTKIAIHMERYLQTQEWKRCVKYLNALINNIDGPLNFFDWKLDFPEIFNSRINRNPGFDIIIGNPPYGAKLSNSDKLYFKTKYRTSKTIKGEQKGSLDTYTLFVELGHTLCNKGANLHYIVPISVTSSDSIAGIHKLLEESCSLIKVSSYAVRPEPVFENAVVNTSILFFKKDNKANTQILATKMYRKKGKINLRYLLSNLEFIDIKDAKLQGRYPKISYQIEKSILDKIRKMEVKIKDCKCQTGQPIFYRTTGGRYFKVITNYPTYSTKEKAIHFEKRVANAIGAILSSNLFFWYYQIYSNNLDLKTFEIESFGVPYTKLESQTLAALEDLYRDYLIDIEKNVKTRTATNYANIESFQEYKIGKSKKLIDRIDDFIGPLYNLTEEEISFIKNYEIQYRLQEEDE